MAFLELLTGPAFLLFLAGAGIFFTILLRGIQFFHPLAVWRETFGRMLSGKEREQTGISPFQAAITALAGTLGTGNIAGVATAVVSGGPGAVFWMWASSLFAMALKYAEILLSVRFREKNTAGEPVGGPMYYMEKGLGCRWMAVWFAGACVAASFGVGSMTQANAAAQAVQSAFSVPQTVTGLGLAVFCGLVLFGGIKRIAGLTEKLVPLMATGYLAASFWVLFRHAAGIPEAIRLILTDAFDFRAASGGLLGFITSRAVRFGVARGVFSNEAGMGSAPIIHAAADARHPAAQAMWGIVEVFLDTTLMCSVTALVILSGGSDAAGLDGAALTLHAFSSVMGDGAGAFLAISILFFAAASITGWSYCGEKALEYCFPRKWLRNCYRFCYLSAAALGAVLPLDFVWNCSDLLNLSMAVPNVTAVLLLSPVVLSVTADYWKRK